MIMIINLLKRNRDQRNTKIFSRQILWIFQIFGEHPKKHQGTGFLVAVVPWNRSWMRVLAQTLWRVECRDCPGCFASYGSISNTHHVFAMDCINSRLCSEWGFCEEAFEAFTPIAARWPEVSLLRMGILNVCAIQSVECMSSVWHIGQARCCSLGQQWFQVLLRNGYCEEDFWNSPPNAASCSEIVMGVNWGVIS